MLNRFTTRLFASFAFATSLLSTYTPPITQAETETPQSIQESASAVSVGGIHTCVLTTSGGVKCWGNNDLGQLGSGDLNSRKTPTQVVGLTNGVIAIAAGGRHTCALLNTGKVKCWGENGRGQLGANLYDSPIPTPTDVHKLTDIVAIAAGYHHTCALSNLGGVKCWGSNTQGELGDGTQIDRRAPVAIPNFPRGVKQLSLGDEVSCATTTLGTAKCWGFVEGADATYGGLHLAPHDIIDLGADEVREVAVGYKQSCALIATGKVKCWGINILGELGDGTRTDHGVLTATINVAGATSIAAGRHSTCAIINANGVKCWGTNWSGQLGNGQMGEWSTAVDVINLGASARQIDISNYMAWEVDPINPLTGNMVFRGGTACAVLSNNFVKCWGNNYYGQIGDGSTNHRPTPTFVSGFGSASPPPNPNPPIGALNVNVYLPTAFVYLEILPPPELPPNDQP